MADGRLCIVTKEVELIIFDFFFFFFVLLAFSWLIKVKICVGCAFVDVLFLLGFRLLITTSILEVGGCYNLLSMMTTSFMSMLMLMWYLFM